MVAGKGHEAGSRARATRAKPRSRAVALITSARKSPLQDWHDRRKIYASLQLARLPLLGTAGLLMWLTNNLWISASVALVSLPLPWIAVLLANEKGDSDPRSHQVYKPGLVREARRAAAMEQAKQRELGQPQQEIEYNSASDDAETHAIHPRIIDIDS